MTPLERAARAAAWEMAIPDEGAMKAERIARAVIEAIPEPSGAMLEAAYRDLNLSREDADTPDVEITRAWRTMLDELLEERC